MSSTEPNNFSLDISNSVQLNHHHHHQHQMQHHQHQHQHQIPYGVMQQQSSNPPHGSFMNKDAAGSYDMSELDPSLFLYLDGQQTQHQDLSTAQDQRQNSDSGMRPPTLNIFPSQPMHISPPPSSTAKMNMEMGSEEPSGSKRQSEPSIDLANSRNDPPFQPETSKPIKKEGNKKGPGSSDHEGPKTPDPKTLKRLAQNREAARKSRLRKKAYVQQLESCRIKLSQLEQELQRARAQGILFGGALINGDQQGIPVGVSNISSEAAVFDMEYTRWLEEHHRLLAELRAAVAEQLGDNELRLFVENCLSHFDQIIHLKAMVAKTDVFHLVSGAWKSPAERCFMWLAGFRPSDIIKVIVNQMEPLTEQQLMGICGLQQSTQEAEEALSQGLESLNQSLSDTLASDSLSCAPNMANYMGQMAMAINKLSTLQTFVLQADNLRHQTIHRLQQIMTTRQTARCLLAVAEYFHRLRALSSLWMSRPRQD